MCACVECLNRRKTSLQEIYFIKAGGTGTGVTLVPVPTKTARCHSDIRGGRPFDVPAGYVTLSGMARG